MLDYRYICMAALNSYADMKMKKKSRKLEKIRWKLKKFTWFFLDTSYTNAMSLDCKSIHDSAIIGV